MKTYEAPPGFVLNPDYLVPELEAQRDALLEALNAFVSVYGVDDIPRWMSVRDQARAAIAAVEKGEKE